MKVDPVEIGIVKAARKDPSRRSREKFQGE
jgi:hypothetical protein